MRKIIKMPKIIQLISLGCNKYECLCEDGSIWQGQMNYNTIEWILIKNEAIEFVEDEIKEKS